MDKYGVQDLDMISCISDCSCVVRLALQNTMILFQRTSVPVCRTSMYTATNVRLPMRDLEASAFPRSRGNVATTTAAIQANRAQLFTTTPPGEIAAYGMTLTLTLMLMPMPISVSMPMSMWLRLACDDDSTMSRIATPTLQTEVNTLANCFSFCVLFCYTVLRFFPRFSCGATIGIKGIFA